MSCTTIRWMMSWSLALALLVPPADAQENSGEASPPAQPPVANWATNCASYSRLSPLECPVEQRIVIRETGRQLARLVVRTGAENPAAPTLLIQLPLGLSIRGGVKISIDGREAGMLDIQTCDAAGCYAGSAISAELLALMKSGTDMKIEFNDLQQTPVLIDFVLKGFAMGRGTAMRQSAALPIV